MEKILNFCMQAADGKLPVLPMLHDYKVEKLEFKNNKYILTASSYSNYDYYNSENTGFLLRTVIVEFYNEEPDDIVYGDVCVSKFYAKRQFKEKNKLGYGKKSNIYNIEEFAEVYREYDMEIINNAVGNGKVILFIGCNNTISIEMAVECEHIKYTFFEFS